MPALVACLLCWTLGATPPSTPLVIAESAYAERRYEDVLAPLDVALQGTLTRAERLRAHELQALVHSAFDDSQAAIQAFTRALDVDLRYEPGPRVSPKVRGFYAEARRRKPLPAIAPFALPAPPPQRPLVRSGWFWAAVGAATVGAATLIYVQQRAHVPEGNLPGGVLR